MNVSMLSDEIFNLPCQFEQPVSPIFSVHPRGQRDLPHFFAVFLVLPAHGQIASFLFAKHLMSTLVQVGFSTLAPKFPESLHVTMMPCAGLRGVLQRGLQQAPPPLAQGHGNSGQSASCTQLLLPFFIFCQSKHSSDENIRRYAGGSHQADIKKRVLGNTICKHCIDSARRSRVHKTSRRGFQGRRFCHHR